MDILSRIRALEEAVFGPAAYNKPAEQLAPAPQPTTSLPPLPAGYKRLELNAKLAGFTDATHCEKIGDGPWIERLTSCGDLGVTAYRYDPTLAPDVRVKVWERHGRPTFDADGMPLSVRGVPVHIENAGADFGPR